ncbi:MAG: TIGR00153 family protein [Candidatus Erginobacter occultus]|nr:TIGR00153 family protein [Candidatus Erginobacter occultus]
MIFNKKEKEVEKLLMEHYARVNEALLNLKDLIVTYLQDDRKFKEASLLVHQSEQAADAIKQEIEAKLYAGAFLPINRGDYIMLAEFIDRIANQAETTANLIVLTRPEIPDFLDNDLTLLLDKAIFSFDGFKGALENMNKDIEAVKESISRVVTFETEADRLEWETIKKLFKSDLDLARKLHLRELVEDIAFISDLAEDAAERLGVMIVKRPL